MLETVAGWSVEHHWLCRLISRRVDAAALTPLINGSVTLDWEALINAAETHAVAELLLAPIQETGTPIPHEVRAALEQRALAVTVRNLAWTAQTTDVLKRFRECRIRALAFKGPPLAVAHFGHIARRASNDIDLLIDRRDVARVRPLLLNEGYTLPPRRRHRGGSLLYGLYPGAGRDDILLPPGTAAFGIDVQVGFALWTQGIRLDTDALFDRTVNVNVGGTDIPTLCASDLLLMASIHGMMHRWSLLRLVADIDAIARHIDEWKEVTNRARAARMQRVLWVALLVSHRLLSTPLPPDVLTQATTDRKALDIAAGIPITLFAPPASPTDRWNPRPWFLGFADSARDRARYHARELVYEWFLKWPWDDWLGRRRGSLE